MPVNILVVFLDLYVTNRRTRHAGHCWRSRDELISDVLLWTPAHGRAKAGRPARTYIQQLCEDTGCCPEDLPEAMNDREKWRERARDIRATSTAWWWWCYQCKHQYNPELVVRFSEIKLDDFYHSGFSDESLHLYCYIHYISACISFSYVNGIRASDPCGLNKWRGSMFHVGSRVRQETPEEGRRTLWI